MSRDGFIKLAFGLLIAIAFFSSVIVALLTYIGNMTGNEEMTEKMVAIFSGKDALEGLEDKRSTLYWFSFRLFLRNPVFGTMPTGYHITGGHSFILDSLAHYGLVGAAILFFMYRAIYNEFYRPFSDKAGYGFVIYSFLMPLSSVLRTSGYFFASHGGRAPEGVARMTFLPWAASLSMTSSSHEKSNSPSRGSSSDQANIPTVAELIRARSIRRISSSHTSFVSIHWSGL